MSNIDLTINKNGIAGVGLNLLNHRARPGTRLALAAVLVALATVLPCKTIDASTQLKRRADGTTITAPDIYGPFQEGDIWKSPFIISKPALPLETPLAEPEKPATNEPATKKAEPGIVEPKMAVADMCKVETDSIFQGDGPRKIHFVENGFTIVDPQIPVQPEFSLEEKARIEETKKEIRQITNSHDMSPESILRMLTLLDSILPPEIRYLTDKYKKDRYKTIEEIPQELQIPFVRWVNNASERFDVPEGLLLAVIWAEKHGGYSPIGNGITDKPAAGIVQAMSGWWNSWRKPMGLWKIDLNSIPSNGHGQDGNGDGIANVLDPADSLMSLAHTLDRAGMTNEKLKKLTPQQRQDALLTFLAGYNKNLPYTQAPGDTVEYCRIGLEHMIKHDPKYWGDRVLVELKSSTNIVRPVKKSGMNILLTVSPNYLPPKRVQRVCQGICILK